MPASPRIPNGFASNSKCSKTDSEFATRASDGLHAAIAHAVRI